jgi:GNAT superfamily N-acetyltransferase
MSTDARTRVNIRPFNGEYREIIAVQKAIDPDESNSEDGWRFGDDHWRSEHFKERLVAAVPSAPTTAEAVSSQNPQGAEKIVAWGQVFHMPWQFHPDKYCLALDVHPDHQRQGIGTALYEQLIAMVQARGAIALRAGTQETRTHAIEFLANRGFQEIQRYWESRLAVPTFDFAAFSTAEDRAASQGITITTLAAELAKHGPSDEMLRPVYEMVQRAFADVPFPDPPTQDPYDQWKTHVLENPEELPDAFFLAKQGDAYVGVSDMHIHKGQDGVLFQGFTGVLREYRGKGIAMALKMQTVKYARDRGYREIRTGNNTRNRPMLRINEAMGFAKQPVWIEYEKRV